MELKAGMPVWAKDPCIMLAGRDKGRKTLTIGKLYNIEALETNRVIIIDDFGDRHYFPIGGSFKTCFTTTPPKEETGNLNPVFKSLEEIKDDVAMKNEFPNWKALEEGCSKNNLHRWITDGLDKSHKIYAAQYREAYEAEKAENERLKNRISELEFQKQSAIKLIEENISDMATDEMRERFGHLSARAITEAFQAVRLRLALIKQSTEL